MKDASTIMRSDNVATKTSIATLLKIHKSIPAMKNSAEKISLTKNESSLLLFMKHIAAYVKLIRTVIIPIHIVRAADELENNREQTPITDQSAPIIK